jgi:hypothetical protein
VGIKHRDEREMDYEDDLSTNLKPTEAKQILPDDID